MGSMLMSQCKCGFESDCLSVGGGMMDFNEKCWTPCYCGGNGKTKFLNSSKDKNG